MKQKKGFLISIDDGYVEYQYKIDIPQDESIASIAEKIRDCFSVKMNAGKRRDAQLPQKKVKGRA